MKMSVEKDKQREELLRILEDFDKRYESDSNLSKRLKEAERKYSRITYKELLRPFTI